MESYGKKAQMHAAARKPKLPASVGFTWAAQDPTASSTMAKQKQAAGIKDFRTSTETILLCWYLKKLPKYNGKQLSERTKGSLNIT